MSVDKSWGDQLERRIEQLEAIAASMHDPANAEIDEMIRKAFRTWLAFGFMMKWLVYFLAAFAGALTAWKTIVAETKTWFVG